MKTKKGMTLMELILVVAVITVLASLTAPDLMRQLENGREHERSRYEEVVNGVLAQYIALTGELPGLDAGQLSAAAEQALQERLYMVTGVSIDIDAYAYSYNAATASLSLKKR